MTVRSSVKRLFLEAAIISAYVKIALLFLPFKKVATWLGTPTIEPLDYNNGTTDEVLIKKIRLAVRICRKNMPWTVECYSSSLTAKIMLRRRRLASTLYFGFLKDSSGQLRGHAWLRCSGIVVTGHCNFSRYQLHSSFS